MKNSKRVILQLIFISIMLFIGCQEISPDPVPTLTVNSTPDSTPTGIPTGTPTGTPAGTPERSPETTSIPEESPESTPSITPSNAVTEEPVPEVSPDPSPVITPVPLPTASKGDILITEVMYNPNSPDSDWEWIEVFNRGTEEIDLSGWVVDDSNGTPHMSSNIASGTIPSGMTAILFNSDALTPDEFKAAWDQELNLIPVSGWNAMGLNNSGDKISLWDSFSSYQGDHLLHANAFLTFEYSDDSPWPADNGSGSIYLIDLEADSTDGKNWAISTIGSLTPTGSCYQSTAGGTNTGADIGSP